MAEKTLERQVQIAGRQFTLRSRDIQRAARGLEPEPIASHFVVVESRRFPPKQIICAVTGLDRADFTTHQARRTLMRLGFAAGRRRSDTPRPSTVALTDKGGGTTASETDDERLAERLRSLAGRWVAIKSEDVLYAADTPQQLVGWLGEHGQKADSVFRVPESELAATGLAPL